jgi:large subunit ribosomal protein L29
MPVRVSAAQHRELGVSLAAWQETEIMKPAEYRGMSDEQLALTLKEVTRNLFHLRFQSATERLETPSEIKKAKREIARILTIQRERGLAAQKQAAGSKES